MNSDGAVEFLKAGLEKTLKETTRQQTAVMETAWLAAFASSQSILNCRVQFF